MATVMYLPLKSRIIPIFLLLNITEVLTVSLDLDSLAVANLTQYDESYFTADQTTLVPPYNLSQPPGPSAAASNWGVIVKWENTTQRFAWRKKRQAVGRTAGNIYISDENPSDCCTTVILASTGAAATKQWDRMGSFTQTGETLHGRLVYKHQHRHQHIFYIYGQFDGWLVGRDRPSL